MLLLLLLPLPLPPLLLKPPPLCCCSCCCCHCSRSGELARACERPAHSAPPTSSSIHLSILSFRCRRLRRRRRRCRHRCIPANRSHKGAPSTGTRYWIVFSTGASHASIHGGVAPPSSRRRQPRRLPAASRDSRQSPASCRPAAHPNC